MLFWIGFRCCVVVAGAVAGAGVRSGLPAAGGACSLPLLHSLHHANADPPSTQTILETMQFVPQAAYYSTTPTCVDTMEKAQRPIFEI